jgi:hypothetical protein
MPKRFWANHYTDHALPFLGHRNTGATLWHAWRPQQSVTEVTSSTYPELPTMMPPLPIRGGANLLRAPRYVWTDNVGPAGNQERLQSRPTTATRAMTAWQGDGISITGLPAMLGTVVLHGCPAFFHDYLAKISHLQRPSDTRLFLYTRMASEAINLQVSQDSIPLPPIGLRIRDQRVHNYYHNARAAWAQWATPTPTVETCGPGAMSQGASQEYGDAGASAAEFAPGARLCG